MSTPDDPFARPDEPQQPQQPPTPPSTPPSYPPPSGQYPPQQPPPPPAGPGQYPPPPPGQQPAYGQPPQQPAYGAPQYPQQPSRGTNALAIASLIIALICFPPLGLILGIIALRQIKRTGEEGRGMALAGVWIGAIFTVIGAIIVAVSVAVIIWAVDKENDCDNGKYGPPLSQEWFANDCDDFVDIDDGRTGF